MKKFFLTILLLGVIFNIFSQNIEKDILTKIYKAIKKQNEYYKINTQLEGVYVTFSPETGIETIQYTSNVKNKVKIEFEKYSKEEQIKILLYSNNKIIELVDTLFIVDTTNFFSERQIINQDKSVIKVARNFDCKNNLNQIFIFAVGIRNNNLIVSMVNPKQNELIYNYYFDLKCLDIKINRTSVINKNNSIE